MLSTNTRKNISFRNNNNKTKITLLRSEYYDLYACGRPMHLLRIIFSITFLTYPQIVSQMENTIKSTSRNCVRFISNYYLARRKNCQIRQTWKIVACGNTENQLPDALQQHDTSIFVQWTESIRFRAVSFYRFCFSLVKNERASNCPDKCDW